MHLNLVLKLEKEDGFIELVKKYVKSDVNIPDNFRTTCSIGLDLGLEMTKLSEISEMQKHADAALYYVKKNGRGGMAQYNKDM